MENNMGIPTKCVCNGAIAEDEAGVAYCRLAVERTQLQHDLDVEKAKSASYLSALAYCLERTEDVDLTNLADMAFRLSAIRGNLEALGYRYEIDWDKVER